MRADWQARAAGKGPQVIVTVTLNTALGVHYQARQVAWDATNQVSGVRYHAAGRGVAVEHARDVFSDSSEHGAHYEKP